MAEETEDAVVKDVAEQEIKKWLDHKKVNDKRREAYQAYIDNMVQAVRDGNLTMDDSFILTHKLLFPAATVEAMNYKVRMTKGQVDKALKGIKVDDADGRLVGYLCALTDQPIGIIRAMDTEDYSLAQSIAIFFAG